MESPISITDYLESVGIFPDHRKILVTSFITLQHTHFASELQIVEELLNSGYRVEVLQCGSQLFSCFANVMHSKSHCVACVSTNSAIYGKLQSNNLSFVQLKSLTSDETSVSFSASLEKAFENGSYHSTIAFTKDVDISSLISQKSISRNLYSSRKLYTQLKNYLQSNEISSIVTFNGRFSESRVCLEIGEHFNIPTFCHETSGDSFRIFKGGDTHGREYHQACVSRLINDVQRRSEYLQKGEEFFDFQRYGNRTGASRSGIFSDRFSVGSLPKGFLPGNHNVSIFLTSEDEQSGFPDWEWPFGKSQHDVIEKIIPQLLNLNYVIWIRVHPNLAGRAHNSQVIEIARLRRENVHVIAAEESVDSYSLISESSNVIVFGSTIGLESTYMGVNTILLGRSLYEHLDVNRVPSSLHELPSLLNIPPSDSSRTNAILVAAYLHLEYNHFTNVRGSSNGKFLRYRDSDIKPRMFSRICHHLLKFLRL
jgi:hypothetical protein